MAGETAMDGGWEPRDLEELIMCCLEKDPTDRPQSAAEVRTLLAALRDFRSWSERDAWDWWREYRASAPARPDSEADRVGDTELRILVGKHR